MLELLLLCVLFPAPREAKPIGVHDGYVDLLAAYIREKKVWTLQETDHGGPWMADHAGVGACTLHEWSRGRKTVFATNITWCHYAYAIKVSEENFKFKFLWVPDDIEMRKAIDVMGMHPAAEYDSIDLRRHDDRRSLRYMHEPLPQDVSIARVPFRTYGVPTEDDAIEHLQNGRPVVVRSRILFGYWDAPLAGRLLFLLYTDGGGGVGIEIRRSDPNVAFPAKEAYAVERDRRNRD